MLSVLAVDGDTRRTHAANVYVVVVSRLAGMWPQTFGSNMVVALADLASRFPECVGTMAQTTSTRHWQVGDTSHLFRQGQGGH